MKHLTSLTPRAALGRSLTVIVTAGALAVAGCATTPTNAPSAVPSTPPPPVVSSAPPAESQATTWVRSMCQALQPALSQLGRPPQADLNNPATTRQALITYLANAGDATQQTIDRVSLIGPPPVENGQQIIDQMRTQLTMLRTNLNDAAAQLTAANPSDVSGIGQAFSAVGNVVSLVSILGADPQLRAAIDETAECQNLAAASGR